MKKKILSILITVLSLCTCMFTLTACGENEPPHIHTYSVLKYDAENHWHECSCGEKKDIENHKGGTATETNKATCSVCNQEYGESLGHVHTLHLTKVDAKPQSCTATGNIEYYTCSCGKWFTNNTATTEIIDKTSVVIEKDEHKHTILKKTATEHWWECSCGAYEIKGNHNPGAAATETTDQTCTECGYVITPALGHVHTLHLTKVDAKPQSCTATGNIEYYTCSCGKWFTDNTATTEITDKSSVVVEKDEHKHTILKKTATEHWWECSCGDKDGLEGHHGGNATCTQKAVCTDCGLEYGSLEKHNYTELKKSATQHWYECSCGAYEIKENHIPGAEATETTDQTCTVCQHVIAPALGHVHTLHLTKVDAKPQSCTEEGNIEYYTCSCGKWFTDNTATTEITDKSSVVIEKDAHKYETLKKTATEHWWECTCGDKDGLEEHHGGNATCTEKAVCTDCGLEYGSLEKHNYTELKKSSTQHWYECSCGAYETKEKHKGGTATCKEKAKCSACDQEYGKLADHTYSTIWTTTETHHYHEATCGHDATKDYSEHTPDNYGFCAICELPMSATEGLIIDASLDGTYAEVVAYGGSSPNVNIPSTYKSLPVKNIYDGAFRSTNVKKVIIPNSITSIGYEAFAYCESLTSVVIGKGVTSIGENAFYGCVSLTSIDIPDSVTSIGTVAFYACSSLASVTMGEGVTSIGNGAFGACDLLYMEENFIIYIKANNNPYYIVGYASNGNLPTYTINSNTKHIGGGAFSSCERLINISIPDSVMSIGPDAFYSCSLLTSIEIPDGVISIGKNTFYECSSLTNISIPNSVTSIGAWAFCECSSLTKIVIPNSVTSIGSYAFYGCSILGKVYYGGTAEEWAKVSIGDPYTNPPLTNATFYYYIENENDLPADNGNYWHYVDGIPTVWAKPEE